MSTELIWQVMEMQEQEVDVTVGAGPTRHDCHLHSNALCGENAPEAFDFLCTPGDIAFTSGLMSLFQERRSRQNGSSEARSGKTHVIVQHALWALCFILIQDGKCAPLSSGQLYLIKQDSELHVFVPEKWLEQAVWSRFVGSYDVQFSAGNPRMRPA